MPFQTQFPGFTLTSSPAGALVTWVEGVAHVRSLFEKQRGSTRLMHLHEHCDDLAHDFTTKPVEVLWFAGERDQTAIANLWEGVRSHVHALLHAEAGIREERVGIYGVVEEWGMPDFARYTREAVPALLEIGVTQVMIPSQFMNNMNTRGTSNMCCTLDYHVAEAVGAAPVKAFCDANYGIDFPMTTLARVRGPQAAPLFAFLAERGGGPPRWNFHKYLVGRDGGSVQGFSTQTGPEAPALLRAIERALG